MTERPMQLEDWLDDLCVRFIINLPEDNLSSVERICFQVEEAQWFYEDFIRPLDPNLPSLSLRNFCIRIFTHCPLLSAFAVDGRHMQAFEEFLTYKKRIPVRGAIMLNEAMDAAVLVKGWKKGANWSFPRGKINKDEDDLICAIREVYEETGFDLEAAGLVPGDRQVKYIEVNMREQQMRLYIFKNVPMDTYFEPRTRKEISKIQWWRLAELPAFRKKNPQDQPDTNMNANKFYMVAPFLVPLRKWVIDQKKRDSKRTISNQYLSTAISHNDILTEEERGQESARHAPHYVSAPESNSLEEATEALSRLLKIQPPTQGLQIDTSSSVPVLQNSGQALLALLQGHSAATLPPPPGTSHPLAQTPSENTIDQVPMPNPPHHEHPRPPKFSTVPAQAPFPTKPSTNNITSQNTPSQGRRRGDELNGRHQHVTRGQQSHNPHSEQSQHLIHPQPLPPQVQRAVFNGDPLHASMVTPPMPGHQPQIQSIPSMTTSGIPLTGFHIPTVQDARRPSPSKLTNHSLALLNAFRSHDQGVIPSGHTGNLPLRTNGQDSTQTQSSRPQPQELPAELSRQGRQAPIPTSQSSPSSFTPRRPISATQRSTLLDLFKSPTAQMAIPMGVPTATALPSNTPSAVELSAVEPLSLASATSSAASKERKAPDTSIGNAQIPLLNPQANLPFRAMSILSRPVEKVARKEGPGLSKPANPRPSTIKNTAAPVNSSKSGADHPFQPQILRRPKSSLSKGIAVSTSIPPQVPQMATSIIVDRQPFQTLPQAAIDSSFGQQGDHRQTLLSLFGKASATTSTSTKLPDGVKSTNEGNLTTRSRVGSLASLDAASRRGSQTPISPADKGFLLSYLDAVANGSQR